MSEENKAAIEAVREQFPILFNEGKFDELGQVVLRRGRGRSARGTRAHRGPRGDLPILLRALRQRRSAFDLGVIQTQASTDTGYLVGTYVAHTGGNRVSPA